MAAAVFVQAFLLAAAAEASDADLQRALLKAGCVRADIVQMPDQGAARVYRANCFGSSHKVVEVVCADGRCVVSPSAPARGDDPGDL